MKKIICLHKGKGIRFKIKDEYVDIYYIKKLNGKSGIVLEVESEHDSSFYFNLKKKPTPIEDIDFSLVTFIPRIDSSSLTIKEKFNEITDFETS